VAQPDRPLLAVCIPTHHGRARPLSELLDRLLPQVPTDGSVEVCVSDNASRDETAELIAAREEARDGRLRYRRNERDLGLVANLVACVEMATATYCWLFGSDDAPTEDAIDHLMVLLGSNQGTSGAHVGFYRRNLDDLDAPGVDWPPDVLPNPPGPLRLRSVADYVEHCGVLALPLSLNVVHRDRWRAVVASERDRAERTPIVPQVYFTTRMLERDPDWVWTEHRCTLLREAPTFLEEGTARPAVTSGSWVSGPEYDRQLRAISADLDRVWSTLHGRGSAAHRGLMRTFGRFVMHPAAAVERKLLSWGRIRDDLRYLGFARHFWHSRDFRRKTLPLLLTPTRLLRGPERELGDEGGEARAANGAPEAEEGEAVVRLVGAIPPRLVSRRGAWVEVSVENIGDATLSFLRPPYAATYALWIERPTGRRLEEPMYVTPLFPPVRPGRRRRIEQLVTVPEPGLYDLAIDLFSREDGLTLSGAQPLFGTVEVVAPQ
jgi:glycosyl transferase family 2